MLRQPLLPRSSQRGVQESSILSFPAPIGGLNARDPIASMPPTDAIAMVNWLPSTSDIRARTGAQNWATGMPSAVKTLLPYNTTGGTGKLFAAVDTGIYDVTSSGAVGAAVQTITNGNVSSTMFTTAGGTYLVCVNGVDNLRLYDGTAWSTITGASTPISITGLVTTALAFVRPFKQRLWFVQQSSMSLWYLPAGQVGGALTEFPVGQLFTRGGYVVAIGSWTLDGGNGPDDYLTIVTSEGEVAVYSGTDPATDFRLIGVFFVGKPIGKNPMFKSSGDILLLTQTGLFPLTRAMLSTTINRSAAVSNKIDYLFSSLASQYGANFGWQGLVFPRDNLLLVNIPTQNAVSSMQLVMNTITGAWTQFMGWDSFCYAEFQDNLYFGANGKVVKCLVGTTDFGSPIQCSLRSAFNYLSSKSLKHVKMVRPLIAASQAMTLNLGVDVDYEDSGVTYPIQVGTTESTTLWDSAIWDSSLWSSPAPYQRFWRSVDCKEGFAVSLSFKASVANATLSWSATDYLFQKGGVL